MTKWTVIGLACAALVAAGDVATAASVTLNPSKDNTLYESGAGDLSNGAGRASARGGPPAGCGAAD